MCLFFCLYYFSLSLFILLFSLVYSSTSLWSLSLIHTEREDTLISIFIFFFFIIFFFIFIIFFIIITHNKE